MTKTSENKEKEAPKTISPTNFLIRTLESVQKSMHLNDTDEQGTIEYITQHIDFKSGNSWMLVFAILIASVGLNMNSTSVVIGAMLISPLMGPLLGAGLALGTNHFFLLKRSLKNWGLSMFIGISASTVYFLISPISTTTSELLARTHPTVYDVLIAMFGGVVGIIAVSRKEKSAAISGVAIATALMPPLCTAGFGLASGNLSYFFGALYLFIINSVFICLATYLFVRYIFAFNSRQLEETHEKKVNRYVMIIASIVYIPSIFLAFIFFGEENFKTHAEQFIKSEIRFPNTFVVDKDFKYKPKNKEIVVSLFGDNISEKEVESLHSKLPFYSLEQTKLTINQSSITSALEKKISENFKRTDDKTTESKLKMVALQADLSKFTNLLDLSLQLKRELHSISPKVSNVVISFMKNDEKKSQKPQERKTAEKTAEESKEKPVEENKTNQVSNVTEELKQIVSIKWNKTPTAAERKSVSTFLKERLNDKELVIWETR